MIFLMTLTHGGPSWRACPPCDVRNTQALHPTQTAETSRNKQRNEAMDSDPRGDLHSECCVCPGSATRLARTGDIRLVNRARP